MRYYLALGAGWSACSLYTLGQWREIAEVFSRPPGALRHAGRRQRRSSCSASWSRSTTSARKQNKRWDLTANKQFSLSDQTRNVLAKLDSPLQMLVFAQEPEFQRYHDKLKEYQYASKQITTEYIDPDKKPAVAQQNQIQQYGTIVFNYKGRTERVTSDTEQDITNGIIKVVSGQQRKVYFTQGHGERDTASSERDGYNAIAAALGRENYTRRQGRPRAARARCPPTRRWSIVAGPRTDFFPPEIDALKKYLGEVRQAADRARSA